MREENVEEWVRALAKLYNWRRYHTYNSQRSESGFPDEILLRGKRCVVAELKSDLPGAKVTDSQCDWLEAFSCIEGVEVYVWGPGDFDKIAEVLR